MTIAGSISVQMIGGRPVTVYRLQTDTEWRVSTPRPNNPYLGGQRDEAAAPVKTDSPSGSVRVKATQGENGG